MIFSDFKINDGIIYINGKEIDLPFPAEEAVTYKKSIIVRVKPPVKEIFNNNVYGFTIHGEYKWQIKPSTHGTQEDKPFVSIHVSSSDDLIASNWNGIDYVVSNTDGSVAPESFKK